MKEVMTILLMVTTTFLWLIVTIISGITEGTLWHLNSFKPLNDDNNKKLHEFWVGSRIFTAILAILPAMIILLLLHEYLIACTYPLTIWLMQPFFHLGAMYEQRKQLNPDLDLYWYGWQSDPSNTSKSRINISFKARLIMFYIGIILFFLCLVLLGI